MDNLIRKLGGFGSPRYVEFMGDLRKMGAELVTWYEAIQYIGKPKQLVYELCVKRGLFSKERIAAGEDSQSLRSMADYINNHPACKNWKILLNQHTQVLQSGDFAIVQRTGFQGGDRQAMVNTITRFGGSQEDIDYILDKVEEDTLGYLLSVTPREASAFAEVVHIGATTPVSREELVEWLESMRRGAESCAATGDKSAEPLAGVWEKLANQWRSS